MSSRVLLSVADVAQQSGFSTETVLRSLAAGELVGSKVRSRWMIWPDDFRALDRRGSVDRQAGGGRARSKPPWSTGLAGAAT